MIGDRYTSDGIEFVVIWDGGPNSQSLIGNRVTKTIGFWTPPHRIYNKKSDFWFLPRKRVDNSKTEVETEKSDETQKTPEEIETPEWIG